MSDARHLTSSFVQKITRPLLYFSFFPFGAGEGQRLHLNSWYERSLKFPALSRMFETSPCGYSCDFFRERPLSYPIRNKLVVYVNTGYVTRNIKHHGGNNESNHEGIWTSLQSNVAYEDELPLAQTLGEKNC